MNTIFLQSVYVLNPCVGPLPKIKISFFLLSICGDEVISNPKIITFLPISLPSEKDLSYQIHYHIQNICTDQHQDVLLIFVNLTAPNKQFSKAK